MPELRSRAKQVPSKGAAPPVKPTKIDYAANYEPPTGPGLMNADARLAWRIFSAARVSPFQKALTGVLNTVADDAVFIVGVSAAWFYLMYHRMNGTITPEQNMYTEALNELFLLFVSWSATESWIKMLTKKERPRYIKPKDGVFIPGDHYSFPSGHTLRMVGLARTAFNNPIIRAAVGIEADGHSPAAMLTFAAALVFGWARLSAGKHTPLDVAGGLVLGLAFGDLFYSHLTAIDRFNYVALCIAYYTFVSALAVLSFLGAPDSITGKQYLGQKYTSMQVQTILFPCCGAWVYFLARTQHEEHKEIIPLWSDTFLAASVQNVMDFL